MYGTLGCHLCDQAAIIVESTNHPFEQIDIIEDEASYEKYSRFIPVLEDTYFVDKEPLCWPFDQQQFTDWLNRVE